MITPEVHHCHTAIAAALGKVVLASFQEPEVRVKSPIDRERRGGPSPQMPLPDRVALVAHGREFAWQKRHAHVRPREAEDLVGLIVLIDVDGQATREERGPARRTVHEGVMARELDALGNESVQVRRPKFRLPIGAGSVSPADLPGAQVIGKI